MIDVIDTPITKITEKLRQIEVEISAEKGNFNLFALIEREDTPGRWDIVISAKWIKEKEIVDLIASKLRQNLSKNEQLILSRIAVLPVTDTFVKSLGLIGIQHGVAKLSNNTFNDIVIKEAYLITSQPV